LFLVYAAMEGTSVCPITRFVQPEFHHSQLTSYHEARDCRPWRKSCKGDSDGLGGDLSTPGSWRLTWQILRERTQFTGCTQLCTCTLSIMLRRLTFKMCFLDRASKDRSVAADSKCHSFFSICL
jgi:hypothetical protein